APLGTEMFRAIERVAGQMLLNVPVASTVTAGATDRPTYAKAGLIPYGLDPYLIPIEENRRGVHGNDERISVKNIGFGVEFYLRLLHEVQ
ncbi:MAG TPA: hypothetical protein VG817_05270, partial [Gemmatimonadales bacterium]|nr:hypothetical protein [Gemmatimonadales bacterium]